MVHDAIIDPITLMRTLQRVKRERNCSDDQLCDILQKRMRFSVTPGVLKNLEKGQLNDARLIELSRAINMEFPDVNPSKQINVIKNMLPLLKRAANIYSIATMLIIGSILTFFLVPSRDTLVDFVTVLGFTVALMALIFPIWHARNKD